MKKNLKQNFKNQNKYNDRPYAKKNDPTTLRKISINKDRPGNPISPQENII